MSSSIENVLSNLGEVADVVGFRYWLEKAIRQQQQHDNETDENDANAAAADDWSPHTIDYFMFKQALKRMARRRAKIRQLLRDSHDGRISEQVLLGILGPPSPPETMSFQNIEHNHNQQQQHHGNIFSSTTTTTTTARRASAPAIVITTLPPPAKNPLTETVEMTNLVGTHYVPLVDDADNASASTTATDTESQKSSDHPHKGIITSSGGGDGGAPAAPSGGVTAPSPTGSSIRTGTTNAAAAAVAGNNNNNNNAILWNITTTSNSNKRRRTKRSILRRISNLERTEMLSFLTWEMDKVQMFYLAHWQRLSLEMEKCTTTTSSLSSSRPHPEPIQEHRQQQQQQTLVPPSSVQGGGGGRKQHAHEVSSLMLDAESSSDPMSTITTPFQAMGRGYDITLTVVVGDEILELLAFCVINIVTARQILIRYDAYARTFEGTPMMNYYMKQVVKYPTSFRKILHHEELNALADSYLAEMTTAANHHHHHHHNMAMMALQFESQRLMFEDILQSTNTATDMMNHHHVHQAFNSRRSSIINHDQMSASMISINLDSQNNVADYNNGNNNTKPRRCRASSTGSIDSIMASDRAAISEPTTAAVMEESELTTGAELAEEIAYSSTMAATSGWKDVMIQTIRDWFLLAGGFEDRLGLEPAYLTMRGKSLTTEMQQLAEWRRKKQQGIFLPSTAVLQQEQQDKDLTGLQVYNLTLNLMSAFLYCMNYYIVEPSSTMYVNRLGAGDALSGTLIGMMPLAAFLSSIPYSMWTNRSFRHPFIMSCTLLIIGNLIYSLADQVHRAEVALLGRFICGLGAPKCIVRRYLADTTPMNLRTSVNAGFGMVVAAGSAMGPATAVLLNKFEYITPAIPHIGYITLNGLTMPGYFMACLWLTFTVIVVATFEEPDRAGLEEQKRLESEKNSPSSSLLAASANDAETNGKSGFVLPSAKAGNNITDNPVYVTATSPAHEEDLRTIFSGESSGPLGDQSFHRTFSIDLSQSAGPSSSAPNDIPKMVHKHLQNDGWKGKLARHFINAKQFFGLITLPVRICLGLLFAKVFTIEALVSSTSVLSKNRYHWQVQQVGMLGFVNGCLVIPFSVMVGRLSMSYQDRMLMRYLLGIGIFGLFLLIDLTDLVATPTGDWNQNHPLAVGPKRYITGYFLTYLSIQAFEGVIGSTLSKVIPTALACGTFNSGLLATLVDTLGRASGDMSISLVGLISLRQLMNLLFIPGFSIILTCLVVIERHRDMLAV